MKKIGIALVIAGVAGLLLFRNPAGRWESVGVAVTGIVLALIPAPRG